MFRRGVGILRAKVTVMGSEPRRSETIEVLVDTGSTLTWIPEDLAIRLNLETTGRALFELADGRTLERPTGDALVECEGSRGFVGIVFARAGDTPVLGVTALERLGLEVDPVRRMLRRTDRYLAVRSVAHAVLGSVICP